MALLLPNDQVSKEGKSPLIRDSNDAAFSCIVSDVA